MVGEEESLPQESLAAFTNAVSKRTCYGITRLMSMIDRAIDWHATHDDVHRTLMPRPQQAKDRRLAVSRKNRTL